jgi:hypothetical protein
VTDLIFIGVIVWFILALAACMWAENGHKLKKRRGPRPTIHAEWRIHDPNRITYGISKQELMQYSQEWKKEEKW